MHLKRLKGAELRSKMLRGVCADTAHACERGLPQNTIILPATAPAPRLTAEQLAPCWDLS